jgi:hypothetical protein
MVFALVALWADEMADLLVALRVEMKVDLRAA